jgi:hypothetical protein
MVLDAIIRYILTDPDARDSREDYGTAGKNEIGLVSERTYGIAWPSDYHPKFQGWTFHELPNGVQPEHEKPRMLGIRINKFSYDKPNEDSLEGPIAITLFNAGGWQNGATIGGCTLWFCAQPEKDGWGIRNLGGFAQ